MRFATLLLLATAVAGLRLTHRVAKEEFTEKELKDFAKAPPKKQAKMMMKACDTDKDGSLDEGEGKDCFAKLPEEVQKKIKEEYEKLPADAKEKLAKVTEDGKVTKEELEKVMEAVDEYTA